MLDARRERGIRAVVLGLGVGLAGAGWGAPSAADEGRTFVELDGVPAGTVASVTGGIVRRDATASAPGMPFPKKSGGAPHIEPVVFRMAPTLSPALFGWLQGAMTAGNVPKNGVTTIFGKDGTERARVAFTALRVSEVTFPALDVASKEPLFLTVTGIPDSVSTTRGNGEKAPPWKTDGGPRGTPRAKVEKVTASGFRLNLDGIDTKGVVHVEPLRVKFAPTGEITNLLVTVNEASHEAFDAWYRDSMAPGATTDAFEKSGSLDLFADKVPGEDVEAREPVLRVALKGVGMVAYGPEDLKMPENVAKNGTSGIATTSPKRVAELYVEDVKLEKR